MGTSPSYSFSLMPVRPKRNPDLARTRAVMLPVGGPYGTGGPFRAGQVLGSVGGTPQSEVRTLTITSGAGLIVTSFVSCFPSVFVALPFSASLAQWQSQVDAVFGPGNCTVTGTPGSSIVWTFAGMLANTRIGGNLTSSITGGTATWARTTTGNAGTGQFDLYPSPVTSAKAILQYDAFMGPSGQAFDPSAPMGTGGCPQSWGVYESGHFSVSDLIGFDATALTQAGWRLVEGNAITDAGAVVALGV